MKVKKARNILLARAKKAFLEEILDLEDLIELKSNEGETFISISSQNDVYKDFIESNLLTAYFKLNGFKVKAKNEDDDENMHIVISWAK